MHALPLVLSLLGTAHAGKVVEQPAAMPHAPDGFGAWNLSNVTIDVPDGSFDPLTGAYVFGPGGVFFGFVDDGTATHTGRVGGKDWPVGEPPGIKVVNDDLLVSNGKPQNCLLTTSYLEGAYLDAPVPQPTLCSSDFQSHKRFKVNMLPPALDASVDLVFNLEPDGTTRDYQVFQKINNYTDARLSGFVLQVGVGVGASFQSASDAGLSDRLWLSTPASIWDPVDIATFSHGLFGPADQHFPTDGFFDDQRAGFFTTVTEYVPGGGIGDTLSSTTTQGSNYAQIPPGTGPIEQFGPWLPSLWLPHGIFFDDDADPTTDAVLMAFWGETAAGSGSYAWMMGDADGFAPVDPGTLATWEVDPLYEIGEIEDLLNLALNYIVTVGTVDATWSTWDPATSQATFTIRMTPVEDTSGVGAPGYVANPPPPFGPQDTGHTGDTGLGGSDTSDTSDTGSTGDRRPPDGPHRPGRPHGRHRPGEPHRRHRRGEPHRPHGRPGRHRLPGHRPHRRPRRHRPRPHRRHRPRGHRHRHRHRYGHRHRHGHRHRRRHRHRCGHRCGHRHRHRPGRHHR